jgi:hypothetical protein
MSEASSFYHRKLDQLDAFFISTPAGTHYTNSLQEVECADTGL